jgi:hypothetical protein
MIADGDVCHGSQGNEMSSDPRSRWCGGRGGGYKSMPLSKHGRQRAPLDGLTYVFQAG